MAKRKEVLLVKDVLKLGNMGDIVRVSPGFARNYLYPYGMAVPAEGAAKRQIEVLRDKAAKSETEREGKALGLKKSMEGMTIQVAARVAHELELFGSIGTKEICAALSKSGIELDTKQVHLHDKIRRLGVYSIEIRLHKNVPVTVKLEVVNSDPNALSLQETLAQVAADRAAQAKAAAEKKDKPAEESADKSAEKPAVEAVAEPEDKPAKGKGKGKPEGKGGDARGKDDGKSKDEGKSSKKDANKSESNKKTVKA